MLGVQAHPKADRLKVVDVDWGKDMSVVITNAANVEEGMKVVFAVSCARWPPSWAPSDPDGTETVGRFPWGRGRCGMGAPHVAAVRAIRSCVRAPSVGVRAAGAIGVRAAGAVDLMPGTSTRGWWAIDWPRDLSLGLHGASVTE